MNTERDHLPADGQNDKRPETVADDGGAPTTSRWFAEWVVSILIGFGAFLFMRAFVLEAFRIPTGSMENTLLAGDFILVNKAIYGTRIPLTTLQLPGFAEPKRGEVVVFVPPHEREVTYVKRLVGAPGDTIQMQDKVVSVNGVAIAEPYARYIDPLDLHPPGSHWQCRYTLGATTDHCDPSRDNWGPIVVPPEQFLVLGDNRDDSEDSRYWGFVPREAIRGRPLMVYFSFVPNADDRTAWRSRVRWRRIGHTVQ